MDYTHAKWISYKWGIPLLFQNFEYADQFVFYDIEKHLTPERAGQYTQVKVISLEQLNRKIKRNTLFFVAHVADSYDEYMFNGSSPELHIAVDWSDQPFREMMRALIAPKHPLNLTIPPKEVISVALHYREGGGFHWDTEWMKKGCPLRFPAPEYYFEQLRKLYDLVNQSPLYVHIFTDYAKPEEIKELFRAHFPETNIEFVCRTEGNRHDTNVLEDMFSIMNFDCLIRSMSHYSMIASHLVDFKIEFYPKHGTYQGDRFIVDQVEMVQKSKWDPHLNQWDSLSN